MSVVYLDTSAFVKTIVAEPETRRLRRWLASRHERASASLVRVEAIRAVRPHGADAVARARRALSTLTLIRLDDELLDAASDLASPLRSLDAIHLAAAQALGADLDVVVTYDLRMARAARELGFDVASPGG